MKVVHALSVNRVVCLDNTRGNTRYLEVNKVYDTIEPLPGERSHPLIGEHYIIDFNQYTKSFRDGKEVFLKSFRDNGKEVFLKSIWVSRKDMITLEQWRQLQLDKLEI